MILVGKILNTIFISHLISAIEFHACSPSIFLEFSIQQNYVDTLDQKVELNTDVCCCSVDFLHTVHRSLGM